MTDEISPEFQQTAQRLVEAFDKFKGAPSTIAEADQARARVGDLLGEGCALFINMEVAAENGEKVDLIGFGLAMRQWVEQMSESDKQLLIRFLLQRFAYDLMTEHGFEGNATGYAASLKERADAQEAGVGDLD